MEDQVQTPAADAAPGVTPPLDAAAPPPEGGEDASGVDGIFDDGQTTTAAYLRAIRERRSTPDYILAGIEEMLAGGRLRREDGPSRLSHPADRERVALKANFKGEIPRLWTVAADDAGSFLSRLPGCPSDADDDLRQRVLDHVEKSTEVSQELAEDAAEVRELMMLLDSASASPSAVMVATTPATVVSQRTARRKQADITNDATQVSTPGLGNATQPVSVRQNPTLQAEQQRAQNPRFQLEVQQGGNAQLDQAHKVVTELRGWVKPALDQIQQSVQQQVPVITQARDKAINALTRMNGVGFNSTPFTQAVDALSKAVRGVSNGVDQLEKSVGVTTARRKRVASVEDLSKIWTYLAKQQQYLSGALRELGEMDPTAAQRIVDDLDQLVSEFGDLRRRVDGEIDRVEQGAYAEVATLPAPAASMPAQAALQRTAAAFDEEDEDGAPVHPEGEGAPPPAPVPADTHDDADDLDDGDELDLDLPDDDEIPEVGVEDPSEGFADEPLIIEEPDLPVEVEMVAADDPVGDLMKMLEMDDGEGETQALEDRVQDLAGERDELSRMLADRAQRIVDMSRQFEGGKTASNSDMDRLRQQLLQRQPKRRPHDDCCLVCGDDLDDSGQCVNGPNSPEHDFDDPDPRFLHGASVRTAARNPNGEREFQTYPAWRKAIRMLDPMARFEGDRDISNAFSRLGGALGEWDGAKGIIYLGAGGAGAG